MSQPNPIIAITNHFSYNKATITSRTTKLTDLSIIEAWKSVKKKIRELLIKGIYQKPLQQNVFLVTKISEEIFFVAKNTSLVTKYEFRH